MSLLPNMLLEYEKEILKTTNEDSSLTIAARGINILNILKNLLSMYNECDSLVFILNISDVQVKYFSKICTLKNVANYTGQQKGKEYRKGGIFYGSSRALITDFINQNVEICKISTIIVLNAEKIQPNSTESFILYLFKKFNTLGLTKAFSSYPLEIGSLSLGSLANILCLTRILLYPRFHESLLHCFKDLETTQVFIKQKPAMPEIVMLVEEILKEISRSNLKKLTTEFKFDYMNILIYHQSNKDIKNFKRLLSLVFNCDSLISYLFYKSMLEAQKNNKEGSWIFLDQSHALLEALKENLLKDIEKSYENSHEFIYDVENGVFRINLIDSYNFPQSGFLCPESNENVEVGEIPS